MTGPRQRIALSRDRHDFTVGNSPALCAPATRPQSHAASNSPTLDIRLARAGEP